jgi:hypothetical protein
MPNQTSNIAKSQICESESVNETVMRLDNNKTANDEAGEMERAAAHDRKQKWKARAGNRYTPRELKAMSDSLGPLVIVEHEAPVMELD